MLSVGLVIALFGVRTTGRSLAAISAEAKDRALGQATSPSR